MLIALLQVFAIGFSLGFTGPCLFYCLPVILAFTQGAGKGFKKSLTDILIFFCGRLFAYVVLGILAGISGILLRKFIDSSFKLYLNPLAGLISIALGIFILLNKEAGQEKCERKLSQASTFGSLFLFGFIIGISPCAPLLALLFEIALISKSAFGGALYGLAFGLGTFVSGVIIAGGFIKIFSRLPENFLKSNRRKFMLKSICALILIIFGLWFILAQKK